MRSHVVLKIGGAVHNGMQSYKKIGDVGVTVIQLPYPGRQ
jgi:hypothetical protein